MGNNDQKPIVGAIIIAGALIAGAILLKGAGPISPNTGNGIPVTALAPIGKSERIKGDPKAKVALIMYEDFQCPFCGAISGLEEGSEAEKYLKQIDPSWTPIMPGLSEYINNGSVKFVYRDFPFLGPESIRSAEAGWCAEEQGKFWEYHDYLYGHQKGENKGAFSDTFLKSFAKNLGLDTSAFDACLDSTSYTEVVLASKAEGAAAGVTGTPKGFILKSGKIVSTIDGAESWVTVKPKIDSALK
ncbi:MAG TPA: thioredoxin domain-containing protein [Candidatus Paceibacterota bacterium]